MRQPSVVSNIFGARSYTLSAFGITYGARVIDSTPPAIMMSPQPVAIACAAEFTACSPLAHKRVTVVPGNRDRQARQQRRHPRDVAVIFPGLIGRAPENVVDPAGVDFRARDQLADRKRGEIVGAHGCERAAPASDRSPQRVDDDDFAQFSHSSRYNPKTRSALPWKMRFHDFVVVAEFAPFAQDALVREAGIIAAEHDFVFQARRGYRSSAAAENISAPSPRAPRTRCPCAARPRSFRRPTASRDARRGSSGWENRRPAHRSRRDARGGSSRPCRRAFPRPCRSCRRRSSPALSARR